MKSITMTTGMQASEYTDRQTDKQTNKQTDNQTDRQSDGWMDGWVAKRIHKYTDINTYIYTHHVFESHHTGSTDSGPISGKGHPVG